jgi:hypothetical protein
MSDDLVFADAILPPPTMYFLLKKQTKNLPPTDSIGTLLRLWQDLATICEITINLPEIQKKGFRFRGGTEYYISSGTASVLMLVNSETGNPCACLVFIYVPKKHLYIEYLDGDKNTKQCGGGATYLLWHFCKCVDNITEPGSTIPIRLFDDATNPNYYNILFGKKKNNESDDTYNRARTSMARTDYPQPPTLSRQRSLPHTGFPIDLDLVDNITSDRGLDKVVRLRKYNIIRGWDSGMHTICDINLGGLIFISADEQNKLSIFNDILITCCKINNYSSAIRYLKNVFGSNHKRKILNYMTKNYPRHIHPWSGAFFSGFENAGKTKRKRKGRRSLKRSLKR